MNLYVNLCSTFFKDPKSPNNRLRHSLTLATNFKVLQWSLSLSTPQPKKCQLQENSINITKFNISFLISFKMQFYLKILFKILGLLEFLEAWKIKL